MSGIFQKIVSFFMALVAAISSFFAGLGTGGHDLVVKLDSNPSTGYSWEVEVSDENVIKFCESEYRDAFNPDGVAGKGGTERFFFDAVSDGTAAITFTYGQHWKADGIVKTVVYECESKDGKITVLNVLETTPDLAA